MKLLAFNGASMLLFLCIAVPMWADSALAQIPGAGAGAGDPIIWVMLALPVFLICALVDAAFLIYALVAAIRRKPQPLVRWHLLIPLAWAVVLYIDFSHHWLL
jgi:hypothetical protein